MATALAVRATADEKVYEADTRLAQLTDRVRAIKAAKIDAVADTRALIAYAHEATDNSPAQVVLEQAGGNGMRMTIGDVAHAQLAERLDIKKPYYDRMRATAPELLAVNINHWMRTEPDVRLFRMLKATALEEADVRQLAATGAQVKLRGVMGKGYRTIDDADLVDSILPTLRERGAQLVEFSIDERRLHAKFMTPARSTDQLREHYAQLRGVTVEQLRHHFVVNGQDVSWVNEVLQTGVVIRHSEVGFASLGASFVQRVLKCFNDYTSENSIALRHVGGKNGTTEDVRFLSDATNLLENAALLGRVQDTIARELSDENVLAGAAKLLAAKVDDVELPHGVPLFEFVGNVGQRLGLNDVQLDDLKAETKAATIEEGRPSRFAFAQGITAVARKMTDYDRRLEVERVGFQILQDDASALLAMGKDAAKRLN